MTELIIIGIANPFRGDDGAGWAVLDLLEKKASSQIQLLKNRGDCAELLDLFTRYKTVYIVDACKTDTTKSSWLRIDALADPFSLPSAPTSTHGFSLAEAVALAKNVNALPSKLIIYALCGSNYAIGTTLSPEVAKATEEVAQSILNEEDIRLCMKKV